MTTASDQICDVLIEAGVDHVFGLPGGGTIHIWDSLMSRQDKIKTTLVRHEQAASCMADIYGRMTGKPAVLIGQGPFIGSIGAFGILEAFSSCSPMVVLTDTSEAGRFSQHGQYQCGTGEYGSFDLPNILRSVSKYVTYAVTPEEAVQGVQLAIKHAMAARPGPACVVMRDGAIAAEVNATNATKIYPTGGYLQSSRSTPCRDDIERAAKVLLEASYPVLIAGNGVHVAKAYQHLRQLAELIGMPVATTYKGKSTLAEDHSLAAGMMGSFGQQLANDVIADADVLLVAGSRLSPSNTLFENTKLIDPNRQRIIQLDIDSRNAGWNYPIEIGLIGDLTLVLHSLLEALTNNIGTDSSIAQKRTEALITRKQDAGFLDAPELYSTDSPIRPQRLVHEINNLITPETILTLDAGNNRLWTTHFLRCKEPGSLFVPGGIGGMGWGVAAALGAKVVYPDRPVISISGDGGFTMMLHVLSTAVQYDLPVMFVVFNDSGLGMVRDLRFEEAPSSVAFSSTNYASIASSLGCIGLRVEKADELCPILKEAYHATKPTVVDVIVSQNESISKILRGGWKELEGSKKE